MRIIRTFILRLLVDADEPGRLRGVLQPMPDGEARPFTDADELLAALRRALASATTSATDDRPAPPPHASP